MVSDSSSDSPTYSDVEPMSDKSEFMLNYPYGGQIEDVDISFASSCEDFLTLIVTTHFLVVCMKKLNITSLDDILTTSEFNAKTWMKSNEDRRTTLYSFCQEIIDEHVNISMCGDITCCSGDRGIGC